MLQASFGSEVKGPFSASVYPPGSETGVAMLVIHDASHEAAFTLFRQDADAVAQFLEIGRAIVRECEAALSASAPALTGRDEHVYAHTPNAAVQQEVRSWDAWRKLTESQEPF